VYGISGFILAYASVSPKVHTHLAGLAISRGGEVRIVGSSGVLNGDLNTVGLRTALTKVALLEVVRRLGESVPVLHVRRREHMKVGNSGRLMRAYRNIVNLIDNVKGVNNCSILIRRYGRRRRRDLGVHKLARCRLGGWRRANVRVRIVTLRSRLLRRAVSREPAIWGSSGVLRVCECLETLRKDLLLDWEDPVLP
jgi:hypothetical protein